MAKHDYKKELKHLYGPSKKDFSIVEVPPMNFLMADGAGNPNDSAEYQAVVEALYALSYTIKFASKKGADIDYVVMPLEGLWWSDNMESFAAARDKSQWKWRMMIMQPDHITEEMVEEARTATAKKKVLSALEKVRFDVYEEGLAAQILYIGAYDDEAPTIAGLHDFIEENGGVRDGLHHEIYLSDPRRTVPEKLKTVIRQPMRKG